MSWKIYSDQYPPSLRLAVLQVRGDHAAQPRVPDEPVLRRRRGGEPAQRVVRRPELLGSPDVESDEHPSSNVQVGQKFVSDVINGLMASPNWSTSAMFLTYDEHGGFYDHVRPACGAGARQHSADAAARATRRARSTGTASGCPWSVISPYAKPHYVSHVGRRPHVDPAVHRVPVRTARRSRTATPTPTRCSTCSTSPTRPSPRRRRCRPRSSTRTNSRPARLTTSRLSQ